MVAVFDVFLGIVPSAATGTHGDGNEQAGNDGSHQQAAQGSRAKHQPDQNGRDNRQQGWNHHFLDGRRGQHVNRSAVIWLALTRHDGAIRKLAAHLNHDRTGCTAHSFHRHGTKQVRNQTTNEEANNHHRVGEIKRDGPAVGFQFVRVISKQYQCSQTGRADGVTFGNGLGGVAHGVQRVGNGANAGRQFSHFGDAAGVVCDGAVSVQRNHNTGHAQHGSCSNGNAVQTGQRKSGPNGHANKNNRPGSGAHGNAQASNDVGAVARG